MTWMRLDPSEMRSVEIDSLDIPAFGLFWWMSLRAWEEGGLTDDPDVFRRVLRGKLDGKAFDRAWSQVRPMLELGADKRLRVPWVERVRDETISTLKSQAERQRQHRLKAASQPVTVTKRDVTASQRQSPDGETERQIVTDGQTDRETENQKDASHPAAPPPAVPVNGKPKRAEPTGPDADFRRWWCQAFLAATGNAYAWDFGKDSKLLAGILKRATLEQAKERASRLLLAPAEWLVAGGNGVDIGTLHSQFNKLASAGKLTPSNSVRELAIDMASPKPAAETFLPRPKPRLLGGA